MDAARMKRRRNVMMTVNVVAVLAALACIAAYFQLGEPLALAGFVVAVAAGFGAQIWFITGLRRPNGGA